MKHLLEETLSSSYLYRGRIINVRQDRVRMPSGKAAFREVVEHPGAVAVLAVTDNNEVVLVKQFRQPAKEILLEVPAGKLDAGEEPLTCGKRELAEETGLQGDDWVFLGWFYLSPGFCDEKIHLYMVRGLSASQPASADEEENLDIIKVPFQQAYTSALSGEINDAKTVLALTLASSRLT